VSAGRRPLTPAELQSRIVITVPEYAATFGYDQRTVRRAIREGQIPALQVGDTWRILVVPLLKQCGLDLDLKDSEAGVATPGARHDISHQLADRHLHDHPPAA
jgi:excisionase family DNA binding protein